MGLSGMIKMQTQNIWFVKKEAREIFAVLQISEK